MNALLKIFGTILLALGLVWVFVATREDSETVSENSSPSVSEGTATPSETTKPEAVSPLAIEALREREYPGGDFVVEETLPPGSNYRQSIVSYRSEGLKIYGLLTVPTTPRPATGYPAIMFVHGYIPPKEYSTTGNYPSYQATLARSGMVTFKPDLRGHGRSEGEAVSAHFSEKYVVDTLFALAYLKNHPDVDPAKIGYWGHSNGGQIGLRTVLISPDIKAAVFWAGVVGSYQDMFETYNEKIPFLRDLEDNPLIKEHGFPSENPDFWNTLDPHVSLRDITAPIELHHGTNDVSVPIELSLRLKERLEAAGKEVRYFAYPGDDHNIGNNASLAWRRTIEFFRATLQ